MRQVIKPVSMVCMSTFSKLPVRQVINGGWSKPKHKISKLPVRQVIGSLAWQRAETFSKLPVRQVMLFMAKIIVNLFLSCLCGR